MRVTHLMAGALFAGCLLVGSASAGDNVRLSMPASADAPTTNLLPTEDDLSFDAENAQWRRGGFGYGGYRGYGYGGYRGYGYGGYRGYGYGGYRGYGWGGYRGYGYGGYYGYYRPRYYGYYGYYGVGYFPIALNCTESTPRLLESAPANPQTLPAPKQVIPGMPDQKNPEGTFEYDGGPKEPVPTPRVEVPIRRPMIVDELMVSEPTSKSGKLVYPAYGEKVQRKTTKPAEDVLVLPKR